MSVKRITYLFLLDNFLCRMFEDEKSVYVDVRDDGEGNMYADVRYDHGTPTFNNVHKPGVLELSKNAVDVNEQTANDEFAFEISFYSPNGIPLADEIYYYAE